MPEAECFCHLLYRHRRQPESSASGAEDDQENPQRGAWLAMASPSSLEAVQERSIRQIQIRPLSRFFMPHVNIS